MNCIARLKSHRLRNGIAQVTFRFAYLTKTYFYIGLIKANLAAYSSLPPHIAVKDGRYFLAARVVSRSIVAACRQINRYTYRFILCERIYGQL